ncbi:hypothetical protein B0H16DRAFT_1767015 [Mycena metata]|uniref:Uncharacterized protein n=1 Tax=Mycena metata TaxID=1033252 RepID=A0AAD7I4N5_9AGAR|nr:hypothetical protein B0H16DRAFT_1767015 [Mycena metata]
MGSCARAEIVPQPLPRAHAPESEDGAPACDELTSWWSSTVRSVFAVYGVPRAKTCLCTGATTFLCPRCMQVLHGALLFISVVTGTYFIRVALFSCGRTASVNVRARFLFIFFFRCMVRELLRCLYDAFGNASARLFLRSPRYIRRGRRYMQCPQYNCRLAASSSWAATWCAPRDVFRTGRANTSRARPLHGTVSYAYAAVVSRAVSARMVPGGRLQAIALLVHGVSLPAWDVCMGTVYLPRFTLSLLYPHRACHRPVDGALSCASPLYHPALLHLDTYMLDALSLPLFLFRSTSYLQVLTSLFAAMTFPVLLPLFLDLTQPLDMGNVRFLGLFCSFPRAVHDVAARFIRARGVGLLPSVEIGGIVDLPAGSAATLGAATAHDHEHKPIVARSPPALLP